MCADRFAGGVFADGKRGHTLLRAFRRIVSDSEGDPSSAFAEREEAASRQGRCLVDAARDLAVCFGGSQLLSPSFTDRAADP